MKMKREKVFSLTKSDFRWDYYRGSGAGGQKRNKTENCCRCTHMLSGATGKSEEGRSKEQNKKRAFRRMAESDTFQKWCRIEAARQLGQLKDIERKVNKEMRQNVRVEYRMSGKWEIMEEQNETLE